MPFYTYKCDKCNQEEVHLRPMQVSELLIPCQLCGSGKQHKIFDASGVSFELRGDGWFKAGSQPTNKE